MRRRLVVVGLATSLLIVISLIVPLGLLVRRQAADSARVTTEREAQSTAALVALAVSIEGGSEALDAMALRLDPGVIIVLDDGTLLGEPSAGQGTLVEAAFDRQATLTAQVDGGWEIALPVIGADSTVVVDGFASDEELTSGVLAAWGWLLLLALMLIGVSVLVADRLGRRLVEPMRELAGTAHLMSEGDIDARVGVEEMVAVPEEIVDVGRALNTLASRLDHLLKEERETIADLSHGLRTPLTSLRLQADRLSDPAERREILGQVDRLEEAVDWLIEQSRAERESAPEVILLDQVVAGRAAFWRVLAEEQEREFTVSLEADDAALSLPAHELEMVIDTLIGNVFEHTPAGTGMRIETGEETNRLWLQLSDEGPGFTDMSVVQRGASGSGSTGLGLDIARRTAERTGGSLEIRAGQDGGAVVRVWFG